MILLLTSGVACLLSAPLVRSYLIRHRVLDIPNDRSSHKIPVPRGGGWAALVGLLAGVAVALVRDLPVPGWPVAGACALAAVGALDDRTSVPATLRLGCQLGVGGLVGFLVNGWWGAAVGMAVYAVVVNVVNFMDGINGISALTMAVWGVTALLVGQNHDLPALVFLGAVTAGCALGFLPWNAPVPRLFLGDVGSYLFGALVAGGGLIGSTGGAPIELLLAPLVIYFGDTTWTLICRARSRESLMQAHRSHAYQRLTAHMSHPAVAAYAAALAGATTFGWSRLSLTPAIVLTAASVGLFLASTRLLGRSVGSGQR